MSTRRRIANRRSGTLPRSECGCAGCDGVVDGSEVDVGGVDVGGVDGGEDDAGDAGDGGEAGVRAKVDASHVSQSCARDLVAVRVTTDGKGDFR